MTDEQNQENEDRPKIHVVDRRGISEDETKEEPNNEPPKLEVISGGTSKEEESAASAQQDDGEEEISEEEARQMQHEMEEQQFAAIEKQMGRPLTEKEKDSVRQEMQRQAETAMRLEVAPLLVQTMSELSGRAAVHLGLMPNPYTKLVARNDKEARIAIDAFAAMYNIIQFGLEGTLKKELERVLNDLKANYANITGKPIADPGGPKLII